MQDIVHREYKYESGTSCTLNIPAFEGTDGYTDWIKMKKCNKIKSTEGGYSC